MNFPTLDSLTEQIARNDEKIPVIAGPTASGKTELTVRLQERLRGKLLHIVSADAFSVYRGMDIGTGKPSPDVRKSLVHHLLDIADPSEAYTAGRFVRDAEAAIETSRAASALPLVCGGSGMYIWALSEGLSLLPGENSEIRAIPERSELLDRLRQVDPEGASSMGGAPRHRLVRAVEIAEGTGLSIESAREARRVPPRFEYRIFAIRPDRAALYERINARVDRMMADGFVEEVAELRKRGVSRNAVSQKGIGYREIHQFLDGEITRDEMVRLVKRNSRRYAKRQETWIRNRFRMAEPVPVTY